ncbi:unannotated protein [freshwater metagenome]|uniref:Unannotated protein n=1 Tax=freshwater metagenome TaxID=449393 RepID=A0A6J7NRF5_9ZZZZ
MIRNFSIFSEPSLHATIDPERLLKPLDKYPPGEFVSVQSVKLAAESCFATNSTKCRGVGEASS